MTEGEEQTMAATEESTDQNAPRLDAHVAIGKGDGELPMSPTDPTLYRADVVMDRPFDELLEGAWFASRERTVTETDVVNFASMTGDWHPAHTNQVWAEENIFGERVAHGMLLLSFALGLVPNAYAMALRRIKNVVYKAPVRFGDTVHVRGTISAMQPMSDEVGLVKARWKLVNQNGETCLKMEFESLWRRGWLE
jgi:3-hydroxybutyryl-CoA dehydratase